MSVIHLMSAEPEKEQITAPLQNLADDSEEHNGKYRKAYGIVKLLCP